MTKNVRGVGIGWARIETKAERYRREYYKKRRKKQEAERKKQEAFA